MEKLEFDLRLLIPIVVGVTLFVTDYAIGWLTLISGPIPVIFIIAFIIGLLAGNVEDALGTTFVTIIIGIPLAALITPFIMSDIVVSEAALLILMFIVVPAYTMRGTITALFGISLYGDGLFLHLMMAFTLYPIMFVFSALGGKLGEYLRNEPDDTSELQNSGFHESMSADSEVNEQEETYHRADSTN